MSRSSSGLIDDISLHMQHVHVSDGSQLDAILPRWLLPLTSKLCGPARGLSCEVHPNAVAADAMRVAAEDIVLAWIEVSCLDELALKEIREVPPKLPSPHRALVHISCGLCHMIASCPDVSVVPAADVHQATLALARRRL
jgi:hypothetical protein